MGQEMTPHPHQARPRLRDDTRGAVYVEFLIAFMPVFVFFLCLLQLALLFSAKLLVEHAATEGARAAAVVFGDEPIYKEANPRPNVSSTERRKVVRGAILIALAPMILDDTVLSVGVGYPEIAGGKSTPIDTPVKARSGDDMIRVHVDAFVLCKIAIANIIVCDKVGNSALRIKTIPAESAYPYQGANYVYEP
jgi:hypothetical protein